VHGIAHNDGSLICCSQNKGLIRIDLKDNSIITLVRCSLPSYSYVTTNGNNIYYTNAFTDKVTCYDMNGKLQWVFYDTNVLESPRGITTDNNNNIYVIGTLNIHKFFLIQLFPVVDVIHACRHQIVSHFHDIH
jgi:archaellin